MLHEFSGIEEFTMFDVVDPSNEVSLIEFVKVPQTKQAKKEAMADTSSPTRLARVAQLAALYAEREPNEVSPFDDDSANLERFLEGENV